MWVRAMRTHLSAPGAWSSCDTRSTRGLPRRTQRSCSPDTASQVEPCSPLRSASTQCRADTWRMVKRLEWPWRHSHGDLPQRVSPDREPLAERPPMHIIGNGPLYPQQKRIMAALSGRDCKIYNNWPGSSRRGQADSSLPPSRGPTIFSRLPARCPTESGILISAVYTSLSLRTMQSH